MKPGIHPEYTVTKITCACGRVSETYATVDELHVEICSHCHPFFTGRQKLVDTAGRVERFRRKYGTGEGPGEAPVEAAEAVAVADEEAEDVPAAEDLVTEPPAAEEPAAEEPVAEEPVSEQAAAEPSIDEAEKTNE